MISMKKRELRYRRKQRGRERIEGTPERPRLSVFRSPKHIYAQVIDDIAGKTLLSVASFEKGSQKRASLAVCHELGKKLAEKCKGASIAKVVFDKNGFSYHGRVKAVADGAREGGLDF